MIRSGTEEDFNRAAMSARTLICSQGSVEGALLKSLDNFIADKATYATYCFCLESIPGNLGLHGSTASSAVSVVCYDVEF